MFGLRKTLGALFKSNQADEAWFMALEEALLQSDVGLPTTEALIIALRRAAKLQKTASATDLQSYWNPSSQARIPFSTQCLLLVLKSG